MCKFSRSDCPVHIWRHLYLLGRSLSISFHPRFRRAAGFGQNVCFLLSLPRKCLITWKRKEMQVSSRVSQDSCSLAGTAVAECLCTHRLLWFDFWCSFSSVLDLNAFERQNKAEGLGMVTEEGSCKWRKSAYCFFLLSSMCLFSEYFHNKSTS